MFILGIETSCDETSAAIIEGKANTSFVTLLSNVSSTSLDLHAKTGGIIPEIAAREQIKYIIPVIKQALEEADKQPSDIDAIAVTYGPGLIGSLLVGVETAKTLALTWSKPLIPVNHLFGHIYANWIRKNPTAKLNARRSFLNAIKFPVITLIVSGGHTDLLLMKQHNDYQWLGGTRDDAAGEAIDKIGRSLNFPYPAGPAFEQAAAKGNPKVYFLPRPLVYDGSYDFSFSGLKTAATREIQKAQRNCEEKQHGNSVVTSRDCFGRLKRPRNDVCDLARGVQDAIIDVLVYKTLNAAEEFGVMSILLSGGVAANQALRDTFTKKIEQKQLPITLHAPEKSLCTDNAAMIATAGFFIGEKTAWQNVTANPELYFD